MTVRRARNEAWLAGLVSACAALAPGPAMAESFAPPDVGSCSDAPRTIPEAGEVPANLPRIEIARPVVAELVQRESRAPVAGASIPVDGARTIFRLDAALEPGEDYELVRTDCPTGRVVLAAYTAAAPAARPLALGTLTAGPLQAYYVTRGRRERYHWVEVTLAPDASITPWLDAYDWWLQTDDETTSPRPLRSGGLTVAVPIPCARGGSAAVTFTGHAAVAGPPPELSTPSLSESYDCEAATVVDADTRRPLTDDEIESLEELALTDAVRGGLDAGTPDAGPSSIDGGSAEMPTEPDTNGHCSATPGRAGAPGWLALGLGLVGLLRRRPSRRAA